ncbi:DUF3592 domain-containing protein [Burkholderia sp. THE68]|uniref:DUF3592 domain-containing protein n=1 Tax=Burkholderia sp. THE68 TaxID=758782 RepID=UPI001389C027|nr:DUF3592 domain-containing protein [Burkholderia sp. THE68]
MKKGKLDLASLLAGSALLVIQIPMLIPTIDWYRQSTLTTGVVVKLNSGSRKPQVEFTANNGERISVPASSYFHSVVVGEQVVMRYSPESPRIARINGVMSVWGPFITFASIGLFFIWKGLFPNKTEKKD